MANGAAAVEPLVASVVHIAAFALAAGGTRWAFSAAPRHPVGLSALMQPQPDGSIRLDPDRSGELYGESLSDGERQANVDRLGIQPAGTFTGTLSGNPFGRVPTSYVLCEPTMPCTPSTSGSSPPGAMHGSRSSDHSRWCTGPTSSPDLLAAIV